MKCIVCGHETLKKYSKFQNKMKKSPVIAILGSVLQGTKHMLVGELCIPKSDTFDTRSKSLYYCNTCHNVYLKCPKCTNLIKVDENALSVDKTISKCNRCGNRNLFADADYTMGGG